MSSASHAERFSTALQRTELFEVVRSTYAANQISVVGRVVEKGKQRWVEVVERLEKASEFYSGLPQEWKSHICQRYFLKDIGEDRKIVFAWNISIQSPNMDLALESIERALKGESLTVRAPGELDEMPMTGVFHERNLPNEKGRGAYHIASQGGSKDFRRK